MTVLTDVFQHEDISMCLALESSGQISQNLEGLDIKNIYLKIPAAFDTFKYLKFQDKCQEEKYHEMARELNRRLRKIDFFKVMYNDYQPYV